MGSGAVLSRAIRNVPLFRAIRYTDRLPGDITMRFENSWIPYGSYWTTPYTKWQGSLSNLNSIHLAAQAARKGMAERDLSPEALDGELNDYGIAHDFEIYEGNHTNRVAERIETKTMPFFTRHLKFE